MYTRKERPRFARRVRKLKGKLKEIRKTLVLGGFNYRVNPNTYISNCRPRRI